MKLVLWRSFGRKTAAIRQAGRQEMGVGHIFHLTCPKTNFSTAGFRKTAGEVEVQLFAKGV